MIETEKAMLAIIMTNPELVPSVFVNIRDESIFTGEDNQLIFKTMKDLHETKNDVFYSTVYSILEGKIRYDYFQSILKAKEGIPEYMQKRFLLDCIRRLKWARFKKIIVQEITGELSNPLGSLEGIKKILEYYDVVDSERENPDFKAADEEYKEWITREGTNITLGLSSFDKQIDSLNFGELITIMGRTTTGKTFFALNVVNHLLDCVNYKMGFFSMEMPKITLIERIKQIYFRMDRWELKDKTKESTMYETEFMKKYKDLNIYSKTYSTPEITSIVRKDSLQIIFIDYLGLIRSKGTGTLYQETTQKIIDLKNLAKDENILVFLLVQLSREGGKGEKPVTINMARETGHIEEVSDFIIGISNPNLADNPPSKYKDKLALSLLKNKRGKTVKTLVSFDDKTGRIFELDTGAKSA